MGVTLFSDVTARWRLRTRVALAFAIGALGLSALLGTVTWVLSSRYLVEQRESGAVRQALANAAAADAVQTSPTQDVQRLLTGFTGRPSSAALLKQRGHWLTAGDVGPGQLPPRLLALTEQGELTRQRVLLAGSPRLVVGVPVDRDTTYVEVFPLLELDQVLRFTSTTLAVAGAITTFLGAMLGWAVTRRVLQPLSALRLAAERIAGGDLAARLERTDDADLALVADTFNQMTQALASRLARDARFASDVSHELRSPVMTMRNAAAVLDRRRGELSPTAQEALDLLAGDLERFQVMVEDLLEISRIDQREPLEAERIDLAALAAELRSSLLRDVAGVELPDGPLWVRADRRRLERVLANLVDNARQYAGGPTRVSVGSDAGSCRIIVDDAGPGVPAEERERVFERFARGSAARCGAGTGLGLALVHEYVKAHQGRVWVEDSPEGGARFVVELPCRT